MKRIILALVLALTAISAVATTLNPVQLLNPAGSTSGQAIVSTGPSTAPAWAGVNAVTLNGATFASPGAIGGTTPGAGSFTTLSASGAVTGTGFSNLFASPPNIGSTAPATGKFTTLQATSTITPSSTAGIVGTTTNDNANAGSVGEYITATGTAVANTTATIVNVTSVSLTAGDWEVEGMILTNPAGGALYSFTQCGVSTTSATYDATVGRFVTQTFTSAVMGQVSMTLPVTRYSFASTTTVFLVASAIFPSGTSTISGLIRARRVR